MLIIWELFILELFFPPQASTKLAELKIAHIEVDGKLVEFTEIYRNFSTEFKAIYKSDENIYELWARTSDGDRISTVLQFHLTEIPIMTRGRIVLKGYLVDLPQKTFILHSTLSLENARKIFEDHVPTGISHVSSFFAL